MKELRMGIVGLGHRGRAMLTMTKMGFPYVTPVAACDKFRRNWYDSEEAETKNVAFGKDFPDVTFSGEFPLAHLSYGCASMPADIRLTAR